MKYMKKSLVFFLIFIFMINITSCNKAKDSNKEKQLNVYVDLRDKESSNIIKLIAEEYKKANPKIKVNINNNIGGKIENDVSKNTDMDIIFTSRSNMLKLSRKGLLSDMGSFYDKNKFSERYYTVLNAYGRFNDKYYGIGLIPYTIEILCNESSFNKLNLKTPSNMNDVKTTLKKFSDMSIRVPVALTEDLDINNGLASIIINNKVSMRKLESKYDSGIDSYKSLNEMQQAFDNISEVIKKNSINKNTFEIGNESSINKFEKGDIPLIIISSYYCKNLKNENIKVVGEYINDPSSKINVPVICNCVLCVPVNSKNGEEINGFINFMMNDSLQKKLSEEGFVTGNKKVNSSIKKGVKAAVEKHLEGSTEDSVMYVYNIPEKIGTSISSKIDEMLTGKFSGKEWQEIVNDVYK